MTINEIRKKFEKIYYRDCKVLDFSIQYFGDEAEIILEAEEGLCYSVKFLLCYKVNYETDVKDRWKMMEVRNMSKKQLGYYIQDITIKENAECDFIEVQIILDLLCLNIVCKDVVFSQFPYETREFFWSKNE